MVQTPPPPSIPAIVLGVEHPRAVAVVRSLGRMGVPVVALEHDRAARGLYSRYIREKVFVDKSHHSAIEALESLSVHHGGLLIPTNDHYLTLVSQNFERLSRHFVPTTPPWETLGPVMDKPRCYALAHSIGLGVPRIFTPSTVQALDSVLDELDFANHSYVLSKALPFGEPTDGVSGRFTRVAGLNPQTARARCLEVMARTGALPVIAQVVPGQSDTCVGVSLVLDRDLKRVAAFCVKRLQLRAYKKDTGYIHPYELGANVHCESIHDDEAVDAATRLLQAAGLYGLATVEFRRDPTGGVLKLIKVDPRCVRATGLSSALGIDLPAALYQVFAGRPVSVPPAYPAGVCWIWLTWYFGTLREQGWRIFLRRLGALLRNAGRLRAEAYFSLRDPMPFVVDVFRWALAICKKGFARASGRTALSQG